MGSPNPQRWATGCGVTCCSQGTAPRGKVGPCHSLRTNPAAETGQRGLPAGPLRGAGTAGTGRLRARVDLGSPVTPEGPWAAGDTPWTTAWTQRRERGRPVRQTSLSSRGQVATEQVGTESPPENPKLGEQTQKGAYLRYTGSPTGIWAARGRRVSTRSSEPSGCTAAPRAGSMEPDTPRRQWGPRRVAAGTDCRAGIHHFRSKVRRSVVVIPKQ